MDERAMMTCVDDDGLDEMKGGEHVPSQIIHRGVGTR